MLRVHTKRTQSGHAGKAVDKQRHGDGHGGASGPCLQSVTIPVPLTSLLLSGNNVTDAGASALVSLVETSTSLVEIDLRGNAISKKGERTLRKVPSNISPCTISTVCDITHRRGWAPKSWECFLFHAQGCS